MATILLLIICSTLSIFNILDKIMHKKYLNELNKSSARIKKITLGSLKRLHA